MNTHSKISKISQQWIDKKFQITKKGISYRYQNKRCHVKLPDQFKDDYLSFEKTNYESACMNHLTLIENQFIYINKSETNGRLNHSLTNLKKQLLGLLTLEGENLIEIDLVCSQPLLLANLLDNLINNTGKLTDKYLTTFHTTHYTPLLCSDNESGISDIDLFIILVRMGKLYEFYALKQYGNCTAKSRAEAKLDFIAIMYSRHDKNSKAKDRFKEVFPKLCHFLDGFKEFMISQFQEHFNENKHKDLADYIYSHSKGQKDAIAAGNDYLAVRLQKMESEIFIDTVWPLLRDAGMDVIPRHDSFLCAESDQEKVYSIVEGELNSIMGIGNFQLRRKPLGNDHLQELPDSFSKSGYRYTQSTRTQNAAIYEQEDLPSSQIWYEVIMIGIKEDGEFKDREYPRREVYPSSAQWGSRGWTYKQFERAQRIMFEIELFGSRLDRMVKVPAYTLEIMEKLL